MKTHTNFSREIPLPVGLIPSKEGASFRVIPSSVFKFEIHLEFCIVEDYQQVVDSQSTRHFVIGNVT
jgi:hypothetical protein